MITRDVVVRVPPEAAFRAFTERIDLWWPRGHRRGGEPGDRLVLEGPVGGRFAEVRADGTELPYGEVIAWSPPDGLRFTFLPGATPDAPTEVEVRFRPVDGGTRVEVRHGPGRMPADRFARTAVRFAANWPEVLQGLRRLLDPPETP